MSEHLQAPSLADLQQKLQAWRREGVWRADPMRFAQLEALARRVPGQSAPVQSALLERLAHLLQAYAASIEHARQAVADQGAPLVQQHAMLARALRPLQATGDVRGLRRLAMRSAARTAEPLIALNRHVQQASPTVRAADPGDVAAGREELSNVRAFRRVWGRRQSQDRLALARQRLPEQAGPLNSHVLVLQLLSRMQALSPDYLRHLLAHVETLQWLEDAPLVTVPVASAPGAPKAKAGKASRQAAKTTSRRKA